MTTRLIYVLDTSTLFNLGHRGKMESLAERLRAEADLWITPQVREEIKQEESSAYFRRCIQPLVEERTPKKPPFSLAEMQALAEVIHQAEISAIMLAAEYEATVSLDERMARKKAGELGIKTTGTLGLMRIGLDRGWMTDDECMAAIRRMRSGHGPFRIPAPGINDDFMAYLSRLQQ